MVGICVQEKEMEKQKLLYQQARLHDRGAAEMVLQTISASKGKVCVCSPEGTIQHWERLHLVMSPKECYFEPGRTRLIPALPPPTQQAPFTRYYTNTEFGF